MSGSQSHRGHSHGAARGDAPFASEQVDRLLWIVVGAWALIVVVGVVLLWPGSRTVGSDLGTDVRVNGVVEAIEVAPCSGTSAADLIDCRVITIRITEGADAEEPAVIEQSVSTSKARTPQVGDELVLIVQVNPDGSRVYTFADYERSGTMLILLLLFVVAVLLLGRWRGLGALAGLAISVAVLVAFMLPALLAGSNPVVVAIVGASVIAFASLYLAHGFNAATNVALVSTLIALALTGLLAWVFIRATTLTGLTDESSFFLEALGITIDPRGLLLAGVVIGSLGVLDDVTVTQVSAVGELRRATPDASFAELYRSAVTIGRDHISSTVNTLFLAYAGAALPLLLLFTQVGAGISDVSTREVMAVEIVRTLVGSIGLVASVPIATALAVLSSQPTDSAGVGQPRRSRFAR